MRIAFFFTAYLVLAATLLPFIPSALWWVRIMEFPRVQLVLLGVFSLYVLLVSGFSDTHTVIVASLLSGALVYQAFKIYPYTVFSSVQVAQSDRQKTEDPVSLVIANVMMDNKQSIKFLEIIENADPDVILAVETNSWWISQIQCLLKQYPYHEFVPQENTYGMALFSRLKLKNTAVHCLVENDIPSISTEIELASGRNIEAYFLHPRPPVPQESSDSKPRDAELLIVGQKVRNSENPVIVAGDLNDVAWSETTTLFQKISRLLDPRKGRGFYNTFHAKYFFFRWPLDHVFHSGHFKLIKLKRLSRFGSDHFPVYVKLSCSPGAEFQQQKPDASAEDKENAAKKMHEGRLS